MARTFTNRFAAIADAPPDSIVPPSESVPSGEFQPGRYQPPEPPAVPDLSASPAWAKCRADCDEIARQLSDAECKRDQARAEIGRIEKALGTREPSPEIVARIAASAVDLGRLHEQCAANDRAIVLLERARKLGESTLANLSHIESVKLRQPFAALRAQEAAKVAALFTGALDGYRRLWEWLERWEGVGSGQDCERPCPDNSFGLSVRLLFERAGMAWQSAQDWSQSR